MPNKGFIHLHLHSQYSLLDGAITFGPLFQKCKKNNMDSVALTDHGNMFGAIEFYTKARKAGIKPIIGIEAYIAPDSRFDRQKQNAKEAASHLVLLAKDITGYQNLLKLSSRSYTEGFYYKPRIDKEILAEYSQGLICLSACISGEIPKILRTQNTQAALDAAQSYVDIFGKEDFYLEIQRHENDDTNIGPALIELAKHMNLKLVATNDAHFLNEDDYEAHNCLCCIGTGKLADDPNRMIYPADIYVKNPEEMRQLFADVPQACENTLEIAEKCNVELDLSTRHAPVYTPENGSTPEKFLTDLCYKNAEKIYGQITDEIKTRIERELDVIESKGFSSYFLINWDFCKWAHEHNIPVGARGSGVGTIVGYCLGLCNIDPLKYDLLFERFMDPERNEMPDIDIDICQVSRQKLLDYVSDKYGYVAQIITMGTMKAKGVIRDVCRVKDIPLAEADRLAKLVPDGLSVNLEKALKVEPELKKAYDNDPLTKEVIDICKKLEGQARHSSVHACGVVIAQEPLDNFIPLYQPANTNDLITQFEGPYVEKAGLLKMDFLGLKTLSVLARTRDLVEEKYDIKIDLDKIDTCDPKVFDLFAKGKTKGVFQFESGGMQELLIKMVPDRLEDLIAANALYRPGPMTLIPDYCDRKHGAKWDLPHPIMKEILEETYGIMIYQEQVMRIANRLGDIPLREAYTMIKAISKKKHKVIAQAKEKFVDGCLKKNLSKEQADNIFELIERFAGYGFNKSHSTRYAFIAYQTAWLKMYYPVEFMAALLTFEMGNIDKVVDYIGECGVMGIKVLSPDINQSNVDFTPIYDNQENDQKPAIRFGLAAVKGIGGKAVEQIIIARKQVKKFESLYHFCENVDSKAANKQTLEALIKAGAFDGLGGHRAQMILGLEKALQIGSEAQADKQNGQMNFFGQMQQQDEYENDHQSLPDVAPWPESQMLKFEKDVLGFYVTSNPLSHCAETINIYSTHNTVKLADCPQNQQVVVGAMIKKIRKLLTKNGKNPGQKMAVVTLEDLQGQFEAVLFPKTYKKFAELLVEDSVIFVKGSLGIARQKPNIIADEIITLEEVTEKLAANVTLRFDSSQITKEKIGQVKFVCKNHPGKSTLYVSIDTKYGKILTKAAGAFAVNPDVEFCKTMQQLVGNHNFKLSKSHIPA